MRLLLITLAALAFMSFDDKTPGGDIAGTVKHEATKQPIPYANIHFRGTTIGTRTDDKGRFYIKSKVKKDSLAVSAIGYKTVIVPVAALTDPSYIIYLQEETYALNEIVVRPGENPAHPILRRIIAARKKNDPTSISQYRCQTNTKIAVQVDKRRDLQNDTTASANDKRLPIYYSEKRANNIIDHTTGLEKQEVIYQKQNGLGILADFHVDGYESAMSAEVNFYQNKIDLFGKTFYSPIGDNGLSYYKYYLKDSALINGSMVYTIEFKPKVKKDLAFKGFMLVDKQTWALRKIETALPKSANINYLTDFEIKYEFAPVNDTLLFFRKNSVAAELYYHKGGKVDGKHKLLINKTTHYSSVAIGNDTIASNAPKEVQPALSIEELRVNHELDSLNNLWWMRGIDKITTTAITGYFPLGKLDLGPYLEYVKHNKVEGLRLTLAARTGESFHPRYSLSGKLGYGFRDKEWKYGAGFAYKPSCEHRTLLGIDYEKDMTIIGSNDNLMLLRENSLHAGEDNLIASLASRRRNDRLSISKTLSVWGEREVAKGVASRVKVDFQTISSGEFIPFSYNGTPVDKISNSSISLQTRLSFKEKTTDKFLRRYYLGTRYPIINMVVTGGHYSTPQSKGEYLKLHLAYKHYVNVGLGKLQYALEAGVIAGSVPFPLLEVHRGNETYGYSRYRFNTLNNLQLASDRYASLFMEYHLNGAIINRLPLLRELNLREVVSAKMITGSLSSKHREVLDFPVMLHGLKQPFLEVGGGFENILNFFRIEGVYRVSPHKLQHAPRFEIKARFQVDF